MYGGAVFVLDGAQAGGYAGFAVGDELAVGSAAGAVGQILAGQLNLAEVGFAFFGVGGTMPLFSKEQMSDDDIGALLSYLGL